MLLGNMAVAGGPLMGLPLRLHEATASLLALELDMSATGLEAFAAGSPSARRKQSVQGAVAYVVAPDASEMPAPLNPIIIE